MERLEVCVLPALLRGARLRCLRSRDLLAKSATFIILSHIASRQEQRLVLITPSNHSRHSGIRALAEHLRRSDRPHRYPACSTGAIPVPILRQYYLDLRRSIGAPHDHPRSTHSLARPRAPPLRDNNFGDGNYSTCQSRCARPTISTLKAHPIETCASIETCAQTARSRALAFTCRRATSRCRTSCSGTTKTRLLPSRPASTTNGWQAVAAPTMRASPHRPGTAPG